MTWQQQSVYHRDSWRNEMPCGSRYEHWTDEKPPPARNMYTFEPIQRPVWSQEQPRGILTPLLSLQLSPPPPSRFLPQQNPVDLNYRPCQYMAPRKHKKKKSSASNQEKRISGTSSASESALSSASDDKRDEVAKRIQPAVPLEPKKKQLNSRNRPY
ncbi:hypothetical protein L5515_009898 [Caenorhabditis briggsae]|uniref:Uncharacterized protein n=1 Tax=Caenorhabditis briggsae TaxID=6238 RepID=A0AAE9JMW7_CAEBR|nr:hypothetical protein L5515_009898 [Caenorhabditis briggsae]